MPAGCWRTTYHREGEVWKLLVDKGEKRDPGQFKDLVKSPCRRGSWDCPTSALGFSLDTRTLRGGPTLTQMTQGWGCNSPFLTQRRHSSCHFHKLTFLSLCIHPRIHPTIHSNIYPLKQSSSHPLIHQSTHPATHPSTQTTSIH